MHVYKKGQVEIWLNAQIINKTVEEMIKIYKKTIQV